MQQNTKFVCFQRLYFDKHFVVKKIRYIDQVLKGTQLKLQQNLGKKKLNWESRPKSIKKN